MKFTARETQAIHDQIATAVYWLNWDECYTKALYTVNDTKEICELACLEETLEALGWSNEEAKSVMDSLDLKGIFDYDMMGCIFKEDFLKTYIETNF